MRKTAGQWTPDLNPFVVQANGLMVAKNVLPVEEGYAPFPGLSVIADLALPYRPKSAIRASTRTGSSEFFAGADDTSTSRARIYRLTETGWVDVSGALPYQRLGVERWGFSQFNNQVIACQRGAATQIFEIGRSTQFEDIRGHVPRAHHTAVGESFLWLGDIIDPIAGVLRNGIAWGPLGSAQDWPVPGTDEATQVQSGQQVFEGDAGPVNAIVAGAEVIAVFQENAIHRGDYVGNDVVWQFTHVHPNGGLKIKDAAVAFERGVFYIAEDGFRVFNYTTSQNVGKGRVNNWFFDDYDETYPDSVTVSLDPKSTRIYVSYAGVGNSSGLPNRVLVWDYVLDKFAFAELAHAGVIQSAGIERSLDAPGTIADPDLLGDGIPLGDESFDDRQLGVAPPRIGAFTSTLKMASFSGVGLEGMIETGDMELEPGWRSTLSGVWPQVGSDEVTVQAAGLDSRNDRQRVYEFTPPMELERDGRAPFKLDARFHRVRINLGRNFDTFAAFDEEHRRSGRL